MLAILLLFLLPLLGFWLLVAAMIWMPGRSFEGTPPPLEPTAAAMAKRMADGLDMLARDIGPRHLRGREPQLDRAADWIESQLTAMGYAVQRERFEVEGQSVCNLLAQRDGHGNQPKLLIVGAHYDTTPGSPGANDNGSGVVACLELARAFAQSSGRHGLRFAFFVNEEAPWFMTRSMGALVHAEGCAQRREPILAMLCLESVGCFIDLPRSQRYPPPLERFYPDTGDFVAFVSNMASRGLLHRLMRSFRRHASLPSHGLAGWERTLGDVGRSDHKAFWKHGYEAVMITDTANFRDRHYHTSLDLPDHVDTTAMARLVASLQCVIGDLVKTA